MRCRISVFLEIKEKGCFKVESSPMMSHNQLIVTSILRVDGRQCPHNEIRSFLYMHGPGCYQMLLSLAYVFANQHLK